MLERIVNYSNPKYIILDSPNSILEIVKEPGNPGDRQVEQGYVPSYLSVVVPIEIQKTVLENYGYKLVKQEELGKFNIQSKEESTIMLFKRNSND